MLPAHQSVRFALEDTQKAAAHILDFKPDPIPIYRLLREVMRLPADDPDLRRAREAAEHSRWLQQLEAAQLPDGSWGRFHSQDTQQKTVFRTTEEAIDRALALGLEPDHRVLKRAKTYIENVLKGDVHITDREEKSDAWPVLIKVILAGMLAEIDPSSLALDPYWEYMAVVARRSFSSGNYHLGDEVEAYLHLSGIHVLRGFLESRYALSVLSARPLPRKLERALVGWIWNKPDGMRYLQTPLSTPLPRLIAYWLRSMNIFTRFQAWREGSANTLNRLWEQRDEQGLWDFGSQSTRCTDFPLSENWRQSLKRKIDYSTCMLVVLRKYFD